MNFRTKIETPQFGFNLNHHDVITMIGSCFAQNIGERLQKSKFNINLNPYGILYNPASISKAIRRLIEKRTFAENELFEHRGIFQSFWHHSQFSDTNSELCLNKINDSFNQASEHLAASSVLFITFGTAYVFEHKESGEIVGNCHKIPASAFNRYRLDVDTIADDWTKLINQLREVNKKLKIVFTVSPIRHLKDGLHDNQLSKSTLLLAIDKLCSEHDNCYYFPAYETVLDDLRDYRFYSEDMTHPNNTAIEYIWELFERTFFNKETSTIISEWSKSQAAIDHRPLNDKGEEYKQFLIQTIDKLNKFQEKYTYLCCNNEIVLLNKRRQALQ